MAKKSPRSGAGRRTGGRRTSVSAKSKARSRTPTRTEVPRTSQPRPQPVRRNEPLPVSPPKWLIPEAPDANERRRRPRTRADFSARLYAGDGHDTYLEAPLRSYDVSLSGVFLRSTFFLPVGTPVRVEFEVPDIGMVVAEGRVVRAQTEGERTGLGVEFERFGEGSLEALISVFLADEVRRFVEEYCRKRRGEPDVPSATGLLHAILAWEIYRSSETPHGVP